MGEHATMFRDDRILANVMRVRARIGLVDADPLVPVRLPTEIRLLDEVILILMPEGDGDPGGELEG